MDPITAIATAVTSIKTATEIAQLLRTSDDTFLKAELKLKLADMMNVLADAKISISELKELLQEKDDEIKTLRSKLAIATSAVEVLKFQDGAYFTTDGDGPFCTQCYDTEKAKVRLTGLPLGFLGHKCPSCGNTFH